MPATAWMGWQAMNDRAEILGTMISSSDKQSLEMSESLWDDATAAASVGVTALWLNGRSHALD